MGLPKKKLQIVPTKSDAKLRSLLDVGKALSSEHETEKILEMILEEAMVNTLADGGSIYLIERVPQDSLGGIRPKFKNMLRFHKTVNNTVEYTPERNQYLNLDRTSIAGYVATTSESVSIRDCYVIPKMCEYKFNDNFDKVTGYRTKSVLAVPVKTNKGKVIGVVQLINKIKPHRRKTDANNTRVHEKSIIAFSEHDARLIETFASHAAVALENAKLTEDIEKLFESFVSASVTAIESRDPSTSGHSDRVAELTIDLAVKVDKIEVGLYKDIRFTPQHIKELRYAALLHDFGKIGVRENVLLKAKKLYPHELETILLRIDTIKSRSEAKMWREIAESVSEVIKSKKDANPKEMLQKALWNVDAFSRRLDEIKDTIKKANESQVMDGDINIGEIVDYIEKLSKDADILVLNDDERKRLLIPRGTLSDAERKEIESHVSHTYEFLSQIAWTDELEGIPEIAHCHHEKIDGTGYPRQLKADQIPIQARIMTICDIFDALTAMDRPYKKAVTPERALEILNFEMREGKLDPNLLRVFIESEVYKLFHTFKIKKTA